MAVALDKIESILTSEYSTDNYVQLVQEIFDNLKLVAPDKFRKEFTNFSSHIAGSTHIGNYTTPDGKKMIVFSVELLKRTYVEGSRSTQRSYAKKLIESAGADAAMIAFYTPDNPKWRLSYVRLDYEMKFENGMLKTAENMTPAKRYSFLVGKDEPCHTAVDRFKRFLEDQNFHPSLDELEEAFSVEAVTNEFFQLYCEKFKQLLIHLEDNPDFVMEAELHNFTAAQFAKKLMGQIVFLYFLQKKGWLGVGAWPNTLTEKEYKNAFYARGTKSRELIPTVYRPVGDGTYKVSETGLDSLSDEDEAVLAQCVKGKPWGSGPHNFMRKLFEIADKKGANFFDDYLEPLFYDALNVNRGEQGYDAALHCRIPFLSGGLFEPIDGYDWKHNDFAIPNGIFSNRINNNPRTGDGILDIFDRYNFTMSEDEPMEREVAIDPEMLGKVFENLLEVNDRKAKGAFYTPREIVHYMCQESLINYLTATMGVSEGAVRDFILYGDFMKDEDTVKEKQQGNGRMYISEELYLLDSSGNITVNRLLDMDKALADVRVADPAVGSGAFPLGMLNEIVRARQNISAYLAITMKPYDIRLMYSLDRSPHSLKYQTIKNCIFAADIEPSAVDIAQLRLWLALVIDDEINPDAQTPLDGHRNPLPLPNLECNILCGNSLIDEFEGVRLINQSELIGTAHANQQIDMLQSGFEALVPKLLDAQDRLFKCADTEEKQHILEEIASYRDMIIISQMHGSMDSAMKERFEEAKKTASKPFVLWQLDFARVFRDKGGFDIVIGNPPYIQLQSNKGAVGKLYEKCGFESFFKMGDIYCLFMEQGYNLLREYGVLSYINPNTWLQSISFSPIRKFLTTKFAWISTLITPKVFEATVDTHCLLFVKTNNKTDCKIFKMNKERQVAYLHTIPKEQIINKDESINIEANPSITGLATKMFNIATTVSNEMTVYNGVKPFSKGRGTPPQTAEMVKSHPYVKDGDQPTPDWSPLMRGSLMHRYVNRWNSNYWILYGKNLAEPRDPKIFSAPIKIIVRQTGDSIIAMILEAGIICRDNLHVCIPKNTDYDIKYILAVLNSKATDFIYRYINPEKGEALAQVKKAHVEMLPIPYATKEEQEHIVELVDKILVDKRDSEDVSPYEKDIDEAIYKLYKLTTDEIAMVENNYA